MPAATAKPPAEEGGASAPEILRKSVVVLLAATLVGLVLFFSVSTYDQFELPKLTLLRCATVLMLALWALRMALSPRWEWRRCPLDLPMLAWSAWLVFKTADSVSWSISWRGEYENFNGSLTQLNYSLLYFIAVQNVLRWDEVEKVLLALFYAASSAALYGLFQALGMDFITWSSASVIVDRYFASLGNPNFLGALMIMAMPVGGVLFFSRRSLLTKRGLLVFWLLQLASLALWLCLYLFFPPGHTLDPGRLAAQAGRAVFWALVAYLAGMAVFPALLWKGRLKAARALGLTSVMLILFKALLDTGTRGAFLGLLAACALFAAIAVRQRLRARAREGGTVPAAAPATPRGRGRAGLWVGGVLALVVAVSFSFGPELSRRMLWSLGHPLQATETSRLEIWRPALKIWADYPLTGTGVDTFKTMFPSYETSKFAAFDGANVSSRTAHCEPLQILATMGLVGLGLWMWLLTAWALACARRLREEGDFEVKLLLSAMATTWLAYLVQNLVSFGVVAISTPFWVLFALLWAEGAGPACRVARARPPLALRWVLGLACLGALPGLWLATSTFRADEGYDMGHLIGSQVQDLSGQGLQAARSYAGYAFEQLQSLRPLPGKDWSGEFDSRVDQIRSMEAQLQQDPGQSAALRPAYTAAAEVLLDLLSALKQRQATLLCPDEVKYHVYLGLAYEELFKLTRDPQRRRDWFKLALDSYRRGVELNPRNAYYSGNLGRLYGLLVEMGDPKAMAYAEKYYLDAIRLAPVTTLFYQNLMGLYLQAGEKQKILDLASGVIQRDHVEAGSLYLLAGQMLVEYSRQEEGAGKRAQAAESRELALKAFQGAGDLRPTDAEIPFNQALDLFLMGKKKESRAMTEKSLSLNPQYQPALRFLQSQGWN